MYFSSNEELLTVDLQSAQPLSLSVLSCSDIGVKQQGQYSKEIRPKPLYVSCDSFKDFKRYTKFCPKSKQS